MKTKKKTTNKLEVNNISGSTDEELSHFSDKIRVGRSVGQNKKKGNDHLKGLGAREGRAAKYESLVTWFFCS